jgi:hypothetical protein
LVMLFSITSSRVLPLFLSKFAPSHTKKYIVGPATEIRHIEECNTKGSTIIIRLSDTRNFYELSQYWWEIYRKEIKQSAKEHKNCKPELLRMLSVQAQDIC